MRTRVKDIREHAVVLSTVEQVLRHLSTRQEWYEADPTIYRDFAALAAEGLLTLRGS